MNWRFIQSAPHCCPVSAMSAFKKMGGPANFVSYIETTMQTVMGNVPIVYYFTAHDKTND